jgi:hypothetical protein
MEEKNRRIIHAIRTEDAYHRLRGAAIRYRGTLVDLCIDFLSCVYL